MHLVDHGRHHIARTYRRPLLERWPRRLLATVMPRPGLFRWALMAAQLVQPVRGLLPGRLRAMVKLAPRARAAAGLRPQVFPAEGSRRIRVALLVGCVQQVIDAGINQATVRLLRRHGAEVVVTPGVGCCGALAHHLGDDALGRVRANVDAWTAELERGLDAIVVNASGCGTMVKDYGFLLRADSAYAAKAARISGLAKDVSEVVQTLGLKPGILPAAIRVAYHSACSLQHGQRIHRGPMQLLQAAGFDVVDVPEAHLCCGSAGTYNMLQPELADALSERKLRNIASVQPQIVAAGNIGCITQLGRGAGVPVVHTVELLDWSTGGPKPDAIAQAERTG